MKIPKEFRVFGQTIKTEMVDGIVLQQNAVGLYQPLTNKIQVQKNVDGMPRNPEQIGHTYCHEVVHAWLTALGYDELNTNEQFVDQLGHCLHQYEITKRLK